MLFNFQGEKYRFAVCGLYLVDDSREESRDWGLVLINEQVCDRIEEQVIEMVLEEPVNRQRELCERAWRADKIASFSLWRALGDRACDSIHPYYMLDLDSF